MPEVGEYPDDRMRTFPGGDPYVRRAELGGLGLVTYVINDAQRTVTLTNVTWTGARLRRPPSAISTTLAGWPAPRAATGRITRTARGGPASRSGTITS